MRDFDHIGLPTDVKRPNEMWVESTRVWVTSPTDSPDMIEYLRYEPDSPVTGPLRDEAAPVLSRGGPGQGDRRRRT